MPDAPVEIVGARPSSKLCSIAATNESIPVLRFKIPNRASHEACRYQVEQACGRNEEDLQ